MTKQGLLRIVWNIVAAIVLVAIYDQMTVTLAQNIQIPEGIEAQERGRISTAREQHAKSNTQARAACYQSFAVNDCLERERAQHAVHMDDLRRQEIALNDAQRKARGAKQVQSMDEKTSAQKQADAANDRAEALKRTQERQDASDQKRTDKERKAQEVLQNPPVPRQAKEPPATPSKQLSKNNPAPNAPDKAAKAATYRQAYDERQAQAQRRKAQLEKKRAEQGKKPAVPLPIPTTTAIPTAPPSSASSSAPGLSPAPRATPTK
jgi:colicin import membrane protein